MSQPPSLPKLSAFLRPGQQQQQQQQQQQLQQRTPPAAPTAHSTSSAIHGGDKRRLDHGPTRALPQQPVYAQDDSELHEIHRQKRRAHMFVQYGDPDFRAQQPQPQSQRISGGYDRRQQAQHSFASPTTQPVSPFGSHARSLPPPPVPPMDRPLRAPQAPSRDGRVPPMARGDARRVDAVKTEPPLLPLASSEPIQRERKSRYLSAADRRSIIARIEQGEKQVALAKEYQVSRAAVCNLYKNRREVLTRADRDPKPKQGKRAKELGGEKEEPGEPHGATTMDSGAEEKDTSDGHPGDDDAVSDESSSTESVGTEPLETSSRSPSSFAAARRATAPPAPLRRVYNASASSYPIRRLVSMLRNAQLPQATLRHVTKRLLSCLMEELVVCLPRREVAALTCTGDPHASVEPIQDDQICAISMETQGTLMLQALLDIFPSASTALASTTARDDPSSDALVVHCPRLPPITVATNVLLLASDCATGARVTSVLSHLINVGNVSPTRIYVATVISTQQGIARVHQHFPGVTVVSAAIDDGLDTQGRIRPGIGELMDRFWHQHSQTSR